MRLAILTNILAPYRVPLLNRVASVEGVEIKMFLTAEREPERLWDWFDDIEFEYEIDHGVSWRGRQGFIRHFNPGVVRSIQSWKPDVVMAGGTLTIAALGLIAARWSGSPFVWWMDATAESDAAMSYGWLKMGKRQLTQAATAFVASSTLTAAYLEELGAKESTIHECLLGVDPEPFAAAVDAFAGSRDEIAAEMGIRGSVVLYVGQLEPYKGVDLLLDACFFLDAKEPLTILLVGQGSQEDLLRQKAAGRGLHNVVFAGFVQPRELPKMYAIADVFCLMSRYEPFGVVVAEAVAAGLPVVCSRHAGASGDLVRDGENGFVVSPEDSAQVADCIGVIISDPQTRERMREASKEVSKRLDQAVAASGIIAAAEQAFGSHGGRRR
ncbi:MAG: glycosyltransferase [Coriobacteriia bacterium]